MPRSLGMMDRRRFLGAAFGVVVLGTGRGEAARKGPRFAFVTDIHAREGEDVAEALSVLARHLNGQDLDFVLVGGDLIHGGMELDEAAGRARFDVYGKLLDQLRHPVEHVLGNHDLVAVRPARGKPSPDPRRMFRERFGGGRTHRVFDRGGVRFFVLDSVELTGGDLVYRGWIGAEQMEWLKGEARGWGGERPCVLVSHVPLRSTFYQELHGGGAALPANLVVENSKEVLAVFEGMNLRCVLQGHLHVEECVKWNDLTFLLGGAVCGKWWRGANLGTPEGYAAVGLGEGAPAWEYRDYGWHAGAPGDGRGGG